MSNIEDRLTLLGALSTRELKAESQRVKSTPPPAVSVNLLERALAYEAQAKVHGGLAPATRRQLERLARQLEKTGSLSSTRETSLRPGTRLARDWQGRTYHIS